MSSNDVQPKELTQTMNSNISNQDVTKESSTTTFANNDNSSLPKVENAHEIHQSATSDMNKIEDRTIPTSIATKTESTTLRNKEAPEISTQESTKSSSSQVQPTTEVETLKTDTNKHTPTMSNHDPESSSPMDVNPTDTTETSKTQILDFDSNKQSTAMSTKDHENSLPTNSQPVLTTEHSTSQIPDSNINKQPGIVSTEDHKSSLPTESEEVVTTKPPTSRIPDTNINKQPSTVSTEDHENSLPSESQSALTTELSTSQILDSNINKQPSTVSTEDHKSSLPTESQEVVTTKPPPSQIPDTNINKQPSTVSTEDHENSLPTESQSALPTELSTSQILDSNINKQPSTVSTEDHGNSLPNKSQPTITTEPTTFEIPNSDATKQPTTVSTDEHVNSLPTEIKEEKTSEPSSSQVPDSYDNKQDTTISSHDSSKTSTIKVATSNDNEAKKDTKWTQLIKLILPSKKPKEDTSLTTKEDTSSTTKLDSDDFEPKKDKPVNGPTPDQDNPINGPTHDHDLLNLIKLLFQNKKPKKDTRSTTKIDPDGLDPKVDNPVNGPTLDLDNPKDEPTPDDEPSPNQDRNQLLNLINEELDFVTKVCPKLGEHQDQIKSEAVKAFDERKKLQGDDHCDLKELKDLKRSVTKLKLQIPAKYRTYDDKDSKKNQKLFMDNKGLISAKLLKKLPRLHNKLFHESLFCKTMQQRYNDLSLELKLCLLCFSVFPENEEISRRLMVYWWIAEGLIHEEDDTGKTVEDFGNEFFIELMEKNFIEPVSRSHDRYVTTCKMQPMIRAALVMISDRIKFFDFDEFGNPKDFGKFDEIESPEEMPDIYPLGDPREFFKFFNDKGEPIPIQEPIVFSDKGNPIPFAAVGQNSEKGILDRNGKVIDSKKRHYFYEKKNIKMNSYKACLMGTGLPKGLSWEKIHMLFNVKDDILEFKPEWFLRMENVNLLFLGRWQSSEAHHIEVEEFKFKESLENMKHVRVFSLQGVARIYELPESISKLESLLILDLRACHNLEKIPKTIGLLKHLTHLDMSECYLLKDIPKEISSLESLQVLKGFLVVDSQEKHVCTLKDLEKLERLRKLSMYTHMKDFPKESHLYALQKLEGLRKLTILWGGSESKPTKHQTKQDNVALPILSSMYHPKKRVEGSMKRMNAFNNSTFGSRLEKLDLKCFPDKRTPGWLTPDSLKGLKKLYIRGGEFSDIGQYQDIYECDDSLGIPKVETWNVKVLRLKYLDELKMEWEELRKLFPEMTYLEKVKCPRLTLFPCNEHGVWIQEPSISG